MKIHFIGIGGIGVSGLAGFNLSKGYKVSGSDLCDSPTIKALKGRGAKICIGPPDSKNLSDGVDLVVYTAAVTPDNAELKKAKKLGIKCQSYAGALGELTKQMFTIAVSGMHGKSTTTAMLALVLEKAGLDPTVIVGTKLREWENMNYRVGKSKYLVIEADEYNASFLNYWPKIIVLTNIEEEHLDYYKNLRHIMKTFYKYVSRLGKNGILVANEDDENVMKIAQNAKCKIIYYSSSESVRHLADGRVEKLYNNKNKFSTSSNDKRFLKLKVPGEHNVSNALAALTVARELKIPDKITLGALSKFRGTWRRMEYRGMINAAKIYDDYGHHPTEIRATLQGARSLLFERPRSIAGESRTIPNVNLSTCASPVASARRAGSKNKDVRCLWCVFQPHQHQRTYKLFDQFASAFADADRLVLLPIYSVAGREKESIKKKVNSKILAGAIVKWDLGLKIKNRVLFKDSFRKTKNYLERNLKRGDICIIMGAGDIYKLTEMLLNNKRR